MSLRFALFSGGHDSLVSTHYAMSHDEADEVVHVNTGIGIEQTREFVRETCERQGWPLVELHPPISYDEIVHAEGFPGPAAHRFMYVRLKEKPLRELIRSRRVRGGQRATLVTGARTSESSRRMGHVKPMVRDEKNPWDWFAPIHDWSKPDCNDYIERHDGLRRNEVTDLLHMSGECLCGSFARPGELDEIATWFPETASRIHKLEVAVRDSGHPACRWGIRPPNVHRSQMQLPMCIDCEAA